MQVREIMTANPACCTPDNTLREVAQMMVENDCGCIPVVENMQTKKPVGTITDRDITIRTFATGQNPLEMKASDIMTMGITTITPETSVQECCDVMENKGIRRVLVVDEKGACTGIVAQADVAEYGPNPNLVSELVYEISESSPSPNRGVFSRIQKNESATRSTSFKGNVGTTRKSRSFFSFGSIAPLLAGIGAGAALKYYFGTNEKRTVKPVVHTTPKPMPRTQTKTSTTSVSEGTTAPSETGAMAYTTRSDEIETIPRDKNLSQVDLGSTIDTKNVVSGNFASKSKEDDSSSDTDREIGKSASTKP